MRTRGTRTMAALAGLLTMALATGVAEGAVLAPVIRGSRNVLLKVQAGRLDIRVYKRDLNIYEGDDVLIATLFDPMRRELASVSIPDDGKTGADRPAPLLSAHMTADCPVSGTYLLAVQISSGDAVFGLRTSCDGAMVDGQILLNDGTKSGRLYFMPPSGPFSISAQALHDPGRQQMPLVDTGGTTIATFDLSTTGQDQALDIAAGRGARDGLWYLDISNMDIKVTSPGIRYWTCNALAYFDPGNIQWMLLPRRAVRYLEPGAEARISYTLRNQRSEADQFKIEVTGDPGLECEVVSPPLPVSLKAGAAQQVELRVRMKAPAADEASQWAYLDVDPAGGERIRHLAGIEVRAGESPVSRPLDMPIVLRRYEHENVQFGYAPEYITNEVHFDRRNRPFIRHRTENVYVTKAVTLLEGNTWVERPFVDALTRELGDYRGAYGGGGFLGAKFVFDADNTACTPLRALHTGPDGKRRNQSVLLATGDDGRTYDVCRLPGTGFDVEQFTGHNDYDAPPVLIYRNTAPFPATFASVNDLLLAFVRKGADGVEITEPVMVADACIGACQHSGGPSSLATRGGKTHIVWGEVTNEDVRGMPTYVATYDHASGKVGEKVFLAHAPPINDVHNVPGICLDSEGYLHVIAGAHGQPFQYMKSLKPNDAYGGWTEPQPVLTAGRISATSDEDGDGGQTYASLVCDPQDTLHIAFRQWRQDADEHYPGRVYAALSVQSKPKDGPWGPARPIVIPPVAGYSIYYHKLTIDRTGRLYLSYSYWTSDTTYQSDFPDRYHNNAVLVSKDAGKTWKLAQTEDFAEAVMD